VRAVGAVGHLTFEVRAAQPPWHPGRCAALYVHAVLRFRPPDRTLTVAETTAARDAVVAEAARRVGAVPGAQRPVIPNGHVVPRTVRKPR
jgi:phenylalanyl-tRNA synthetase beta subunit